MFRSDCCTFDGVVSKMGLQDCAAVRLPVSGDPVIIKTHYPFLNPKKETSKTAGNGTGTATSTSSLDQKARLFPAF